MKDFITKKKDLNIKKRAMIQKRQIVTNNSKDCSSLCTPYQAFSKWSVHAINYNCPKHAKNDSTRTLELPLEKTPNSREKRLFKSATMQRLKPLQNPHFGSKIKIPKNMSKSILQII